MSAKSSITSIFKKNHQGKRAYRHFLDEAWKTSRWVFARNSEGVRPLKDVGQSILLSFMTASFARKLVATALVGAVSGATLGYKLSLRHLRNAEINQTIGKLKGADSEIKATPAPLTFSSFWDDFSSTVRRDFKQAYYDTNFVTAGLKGAGGVSLLFVLAAAAVQSRRKYEQSNPSLGLHADPAGAAPGPQVPSPE